MNSRITTLYSARLVVKVAYMVKVVKVVKVVNVFLHPLYSFYTILCGHSSLEPECEK